MNVDDFYYECANCGYKTTNPLDTEHDCGEVEFSDEAEFYG